MIRTPRLTFSLETQWCRADSVRTTGGIKICGQKFPPIIDRLRVSSSALHSSSRVYSLLFKFIPLHSPPFSLPLAQCRASSQRCATKKKDKEEEEEEEKEKEEKEDKEDKEEEEEKEKEEKEDKEEEEEKEKEEKEDKEEEEEKGKEEKEEE
ncbi:hypothetical protein PoB_002941900 [Plakobranchus ocellatus]|uniref:Uncharacterized protein n=1 Tax=Plakobranchus ocellatus TaxID=259542 RepID=A0AAV4A5F3_9GAST|nr:hypothetical protein PoB_002941900 [Plakobranchus ocellatus]